MATLHDILVPMCARGFLRQVTRLCVASKELGEAAPMGTPRQIYDASRDGKITALETYLAYWEGSSESREVLTNWVSLDGSSCLQAAVRWKRLACVSLLAPFVDVNGFPGSEQLSPLHLACYRGNVPIVRVLLAVPGININAQNYPRQKSPLHWAAAQGHAEVVQILVGLNDIKLEAIASTGGDYPLRLTPAQMAWEGKHVAVIAILNKAIQLEKAADAKGKKLFRAAYNGDVARLQELTVKAAGNANVLNWVYPIKASNDNDDDEYDEYDDNADAGFEFFMEAKTPLLIAARQGHLEAVRLLLSTPGVDARKMDDHKKSTIVICAAKHGHHEILRLVLAAAPDIDVNHANVYLDTALLAAVKRGHLECVRELCDLPHVDVDKTDHRGYSALTCAAVGQNLEMVRLLCRADLVDRSKDKGVSALMEAVYSRSLEVVRALLEAVPRGLLNTQACIKKFKDVTAMDLAKTAELNRDASDKRIVALIVALLKAAGAQTSKAASR